jgi:hypothetical protein
MSNQKRLEKYLVGNQEQSELGYLQKDISNGKVIILLINKISLKQES